MRLFQVVAALTVGMAAPTAAQDVSPDVYWARVYQTYWDEVASYNDCATRPDFCEQGRQSRCDELWYVRNQLYNSAGQCFESPLGQAMFDNTDCNTNTATLGSFHAEYVAHIRAEEQVLRCAVDTSVSEPLEIVDLELRMNAYPFIGGDGASTGCNGWKGPTFSLHAEPRADAPVVAEVQAGDNLVIYLESYSQPGAFWYYGLFDESGNGAEGWGAVPVFPPEAPDQCDSYAG